LLNTKSFFGFGLLFAAIALMLTTPNISFAETEEDFCPPGLKAKGECSEGEAEVSEPIKRSPPDHAQAKSGGATEEDFCPPGLKAKGECSEGEAEVSEPIKRGKPTDAGKPTDTAKPEGKGSTMSFGGILDSATTSQQDIMTSGPSISTGEAQHTIRNRYKGLKEAKILESDF